MRKLSVRPGSFGPYANEAYDRLPEMVIQYVEIAVPSRETISTVKAELSAAGLTALSLQGNFDVKSPTALTDFEPDLEMIAAMESPYLFLSVKHEETPEGLAYERLHALGEVLKPIGVTAVLETHPDMISNGDIALKTMQGVNHPNVLVNFDTANIYFYNEGINGVDEMRKVIDYIGAIHLKDTDGGFKNWHFPALGEGIVDFLDVYQTLDEHGYDGPYTMELEGIEGESLSREEHIARVQNSVSHMEKLGFMT